MQNYCLIGATVLMPHAVLLPLEISPFFKLLEDKCEHYCKWGCLLTCTLEMVRTQNTVNSA